MPDDLYKTLMDRRSARNFEDKEIPEELVEKILDVAVSAPTGGNIEPLSVIAITSPEGRKDIGDMFESQPWVGRAPLSLIFCLDFYRLKKWAAHFNTPFRGEESVSSFVIAYADMMCAAQSVVVYAQSQGLGSVYIGTIMYGADDVRAAYKIPKYVLPLMLLCIGYPKTVPQNIPKLDREFLIHREEYSTPSDKEIAEAYERKYGEIESNMEKYLEKAFVEALEAEGQEDNGIIEYVKEQMKKLEIKSNSDFLFKLRYPADMMVEINEGIIESWKNAGFDFSAKE